MAYLKIIRNHDKRPRSLRGLYRLRSTTRKEAGSIFIGPCSWALGLLLKALDQP